LVVIAIIGILVALLLPAIQAAREAARRAQCTNNLKQIGIACVNYGDSKKTLPPGSGYMHKEAIGTWAIKIFPFMEEQAIADRWDYDELGDQPDSDADGLSNVKTAEETIIAAMICPSDEQASSPILTGRRPGTAGVVTKDGNNPPTAQGLWYTGSMGPTIPTNCVFLPQSLPFAVYLVKKKIFFGGTDFCSLTPATDAKPNIPNEDAK
jgi:type II secretory pathway pseudopilin PulG